MTWTPWISLCLSIGTAVLLYLMFPNSTWTDLNIGGKIWELEKRVENLEKQWF